MTDTELYQIVKDHREAWPEHYVYDEWFSCFALRGTLEVCGHGDTRQKQVDTKTAVLAFEASFHRAILARTNVSVDKWPDGFIVRVQSHSFDSPRLIEAYANALEWLK